jgi:hypothetical protein
MRAITLVVLSCLCGCGSATSPTPDAAGVPDAPPGTPDAAPIDAPPPADAMPQPYWTPDFVFDAPLNGGSAIGVGANIYFGQADYPFDASDLRTWKKWSVLTSTVSPLAPIANNDVLCNCGYGGHFVSDGTGIYYIANDAIEYVIASDKWSSLTYPLEAQRGEAATALVNGKIYLVGGRGDLKTVEAYDLATGGWTLPTVLPDYPVALSDAHAASVSDQLIVFGGTTGGARIHDVYAFDPAGIIGGWVALAPIPSDPEYGTEGVVLDDKLFVLTIAGLARFDRSLGPTGTWTMVAPRPPSGGPRAMVLAAGSIYVVAEDQTTTTFWRLVLP